MPDDSNLPRCTVTADEFRLHAMAAGWKAKAVELFLKPPLCQAFVAVGEQKMRRLVRVIGPGGK